MLVNVSLHIFFKLVNLKDDRAFVLFAFCVLYKTLVYDPVEKENCIGVVGVCCTLGPVSEDTLKC